jgi:hypothetical protein
MKRIAIWVVIVLTCLTGMGIAWWTSDPAVHWSTVEKSFKGHFYRSDDNQSHDRDWIPLSVQSHPRRVYLDWKRSRMHFALGFPNMDMGFHDETGKHDIALSVHLYENFARGITIASDEEDRERAKEILATVTKMFPRLPVRCIGRSPPSMEATQVQSGVDTAGANRVYGDESSNQK